jgi:hypothetical protein
MSRHSKSYQGSHDGLNWVATTQFGIENYSHYRIQGTQLPQYDWEALFKEEQVKTFNLRARVEVLENRMSVAIRTLNGAA